MPDCHVYVARLSSFVARLVLNIQERARKRAIKERERERQFDINGKRERERMIDINGKWVRFVPNDANQIVQITF